MIYCHIQDTLWKDLPLCRDAYSTTSADWATEKKKIDISTVREKNKYSYYQRKGTNVAAIREKGGYLLNLG